MPPSHHPAQARTVPMPAGAGGASDVGPASGLPYFNIGGWDIYLGDIGNIQSYGINIPGGSGPYINLPDFNFPVGLGGVPILQPSPVIFAPDAALVTLEQQDAVEEGTGDLPPAIDRRDETQNESDLPVPLGNISDPLFTGGVQSVQARDWIEYWELVGKGLSPLPPLPRDAPATPTAQIVSAEEDDVGWISDVYDVVDTSVGGILPGGVPVGTTNVFTPTPPITGTPAVIPSPAVTVIPGTGTPVPVASAKSYCMKLIDGQWRMVKMRRRRRKQLATKGDLQDLAALKGILGTGKAFEVWIATHS